MESQTCIFCKIGKKEIPSKVIYEDSAHIAFLDIRPYTKGHTLVIPKKHYIQFLEIPKKEVSELFALAQEIGKKLKTSLKAELIFLSVMGEEVPHTHVHLIPYYGEMPFTMRHEPPDEDLDKILKEIKEYKEKK
ncbi:TPA: HIT domain-containing protein [archaeon]|uniref:HIT domain-containing protein n=1 Tax=Candidatus Naiadarchaeum limnaeum TaxID=2756139 RepID=A0A832XJB2_9ARCH|nr:HIT domain-containing protein [Candidatus Naiadarchaeales archaeon SRR2090153.bin1042]HIK00337.1 HIT domain-containing protein [Candidatus Naiadarchaeum limnaeum]